MHKRVRILTNLVTVCMLSSGCSDDEPEAQDIVATTASPSADFTSYHTFALAPSKDSAAIPADVATNLVLVNEAIVEELEDHGLQQVDPGDDPDLIAFNLATSDTEGGYYWDCVDGYWWGYWGVTWTPCEWLAPVYTEYTAGTIALGLADPDLRQVVFGGLIRGVADYTVDAEERIDDDVELIFESYPATQTGY